MKYINSLLPIIYPLYLELINIHKINRLHLHEEQPVYLPVDQLGQLQSFGFTHVPPFIQDGRHMAEIQ
jgi:hypothetical protein